MKRASIKAVNAAIQAKGHDAQLHKGTGYFYFDGDCIRTDQRSVYVTRITDLSHEVWMQHFEDALKKPAPVVQLVPRSEAPHAFNYTVQEQAKAGNWVDSMSCNHLQAAIENAQHAIETHKVQARVVDNRK